MPTNPETSNSNSIGSDSSLGGGTTATGGGQSPFQELEKLPKFKDHMAEDQGDSYENFESTASPEIEDPRYEGTKTKSHEVRKFIVFLDDERKGLLSKDPVIDNQVEFNQIEANIEQLFDYSSFRGEASEIMAKERKFLQMIARPVDYGNGRAETEQPRGTEQVFSEIADENGDISDYHTRKVLGWLKGSARGFSDGKETNYIKIGDFDAMFSDHDTTALDYYQGTDQLLATLQESLEMQGWNQQDIDHKLLEYDKVIRILGEKIFGAQDRYFHKIDEYITDQIIDEEKKRRVHEWALVFEGDPAAENRRKRMDAFAASYRNDPKIHWYHEGFEDPNKFHSLHSWGRFESKN